MILYHPKFGTELSEYGIVLPLRDDRSSQVFKILKESFPDLTSTEPELIQKLNLSEFNHTHDQEFLNKLLEDDTFLEEMMDTYECSQPGRFQPDQTSKPISHLRDNIVAQVSATRYGLDLALKSGFCFFLGGGMHHGRSDKGGGFCPVNDIVISLRDAQKSGAIKRAIVIDTDAHFGDGTAEITANDASISTLSIHMKDGWPFDQGVELIGSDIDIPIGKGEEDSYLERLGDGLDEFSNKSFDCAIVVAGADPHESDELLSTKDLKLTSSQMLARDMLVYKWCQDRNIPQLWLMAGGYGQSAPGVYAQFILKVLHLMR